MKRSLMIGLALGSLVVLAGCAHHVETVVEGVPAAGSAGPGGAEGLAASGANSTFSVTKTCAKTVCDEKASSSENVCEECLSASNENNDECSSFCDSGSSCDASDKTTCAESSFTVKDTSAPDASILAACTDFWKGRFFPCATASAGVDVETDGDDQEDDLRCAAYAKSMTPDAIVSYFQCRTAESCDVVSTGNTNCAMPEPTTLGTQLCTGVESACGVDPSWFDCGNASNSDRNYYDQYGAFLRDDAVKAGLSCLSNSCDDIERCIHAWDTAAFGDLFSSDE